jgi:serine/threonine protein phosphatase 1
MMENKGIYIIGDVHGCLKTLKALIKKIPKGGRVVLTGDLIDRGPNSRGVVQYIIDNEYLCVLGNHEDFMLDGRRSYRDWMRNGGYETLESYGFKDADYEPNNEKNLKLLKYKRILAHRDWMGKLPIYLLFDDIVNEKGEKLLVSHSSASKAWVMDEEERKNSYSYFKDLIIWGRDYSPTPIPGIYNVFGHTPVEKVVSKSGCSFIDTGAVFKNKLTALHFPSMETIVQDFID